MRHSRIASRLLLSIGLIGCFSVSVSAQAIHQWNQHGWSAGAYANERTKAFSHCAASIKYRSGILLVFSVTKDFRWAMGFANPQWRLNKGSRYNIKYAVDAYPALETTAIAVSASQVSAELPANTTLFQLFRKGRLLKVQGQGQNFGFSLDNTSSVLAALLGCANRYKSGSAPIAANTNPFEKAVPVAPPSNSALNRAEAATVAANVLSSAGIQGFSLVSEIPDNLNFLDAIWKAPGIIGGVQILEGETPAIASSRQIALDAQSCAGTFASGKLPASGNAVRVMTACTVDGKDPERVEYTMVQRSKGGVYVFILMPVDAAPADISDHGARVMDAALKNLR